ncbi:conserved hypothetical protein [Pyrenophora tritici-repentis Pt-1C-BFP]|uniref:Uncharacterized protein n=1 Tax=Pyrenophora tritici-repentis (strain Pt-1C-BFP) TaxID=426418 RepID=B2WME6_PYRTR|nr:uncharacterized protein PTRG_11156 [Pyrenophora tritici-repentis Pt-1C-BFP]EDU44206.1 conserved hypothetical protein [Pyrenophora tritici-repentis Pt-1C-BFP]
MPFETARNWSSYHVIPQSADVALNPLESYFFVTDFLIIGCSILYTLCYMFYTIRTYSDRTTFQRICFFVWFLFDITFVTVALKSAYAPRERGRTVVKLLWQVPAWMLFLCYVGMNWPDEREQRRHSSQGYVLSCRLDGGRFGICFSDKIRKGSRLRFGSRDTLAVSRHSWCSSGGTTMCQRTGPMWGTVGALVV